MIHAVENSETFISQNNFVIWNIFPGHFAVFAWQWRPSTKISTVPPNSHNKIEYKYDIIKLIGRDIEISSCEKFNFFFV